MMRIHNNGWIRIRRRESLQSGRLPVPLSKANLCFLARPCHVQTAWNVKADQSNTTSSSGKQEETIHAFPSVLSLICPVFEQYCRYRTRLDSDNFQSVPKLESSARFCNISVKYYYRIDTSTFFSILPLRLYVASVFSKETVTSPRPATQGQKSRIQNEAKNASACKKKQKKIMTASPPISFCNLVFAATRSQPSTGIWDSTTRQRKSSRKVAWKKLAVPLLNTADQRSLALSFVETEVSHVIRVFHRRYGIPRQSERLVRLR